MGLSPHPDAASSCRSGIQTRAYLNSTYPYLPATLVPTDCLHPHSYTVDEGIHSINRLPKFPSTKLSQCQYDNRHQSRYPYTPAIQPQVHVSEHNRNAQTFPSHLDRRNRQVPNHSHSASINAAPASSCSPAKRGVAMVFVPEQPAKRAMMFEPSLFQRNDPSAAPQETHGRVPLSELNIPTALLDRYTHTKSLRASAAGPPRRPYVDLIPPSAPPLSSPAPRRECSRMRFAPRSHEEENEVIFKTPPKTRHLPRATSTAPPMRSNTKPLRTYHNSTPQLRV